MKYTSNWVAEFPRKADDAIQPIAKHVLPYFSDADALRILDVFTNGKASRLHERGVPVDN